MKSKSDRWSNFKRNTALVLFGVLLLAAAGCSDNDGSSAEKETLTATITPGPG